MSVNMKVIAACRTGAPATSAIREEQLHSSKVESRTEPLEHAAGRMKVSSGGGQVALRRQRLRVEHAGPCALVGQLDRGHRRHARPRMGTASLAGPRAAGARPVR